MKKDFNAKIFNGEVFGQYAETLPRLKRNALLESRAIIPNNEIKAAMSEQVGGNIYTAPMFGRIKGEPVNYDGETDILAYSTETFSQTRVIIGRAVAFVERDFSYDITGGVKFMDVVAQQIVEYWDDVDQDTLLAVLKGLFAMTGAKNTPFVDEHTTDVSAIDEGKFTEVTLNNALQKAVGQNKAKFSLAIMHSQVATNLENLNLLEYMKYTDENGIERDLGIATLNGKTVLIDDSMPVEVVSGAEGEEDYNKYTTYIFGEGAFQFTDAGVNVPFEMSRDPKVNGGQDTLYSRQRVCYAPYGISFTQKSMASLSPTNAELEKGGNWELVQNDKNTIDHKAIPIARIISRG